MYRTEIPNCHHGPQTRPEPSSWVGNDSFSPFNLFLQNKHQHTYLRTKGFSSLRQNYENLIMYQHFNNWLDLIKNLIDQRN